MIGRGGKSMGGRRARGLGGRWGRGKGVRGQRGVGQGSRKLEGFQKPRISPNKDGRLAGILYKLRTMQGWGWGRGLA